MLEDLMNDYGSRLFIAMAGVGFGLLCLFVLLVLLRRRRGPSPFLRGGKNRQPRLQVLDAAAVDARRRIVLIRRDDVEHLVMIGGPTDVVIESSIRPGQPPAASAAPAEPPVTETRLPAPPRPHQLPAPSPEPKGGDMHALPVAREPAREAARVREEPVAAKPMPRETRPVSRPQPAPVVQPAPAVAPSPARPAAEPSRDAVPAEAANLDAPPTDTRPVRTTEPAAAPSAAAPEQDNPGNGAVHNDAPTIGAATDALDAARRRVFQPALDRTPPPAAAPGPATPQADAEKPRALGSDFDRILEEEMANNLAGEQTPPGPTPAPGALPRRDPAHPRVTGATAEPSLQTEMARIFGEMSVTRNDR